MEDAAVSGQGTRAESGEAVATAMTAEDLAAVRELALWAHPDAVPELVGGGSVAEVIASLEPARAAYQRIAAAVGQRAGGAEAAPIAPSVPAGDAPRLAVDPDALPAAEKIRRGQAGRSSEA